MDAHSRQAQLFPVLTQLQIEVAKRFASGEARVFSPGEPVSGIGDRHVPAWLVLSGRLDVLGKIGSHAETAIVSHGAGQFSGELNQLSGRPSMAGSRAGDDGCVAIPFDATHVKALIIRGLRAGNRLAIQLGELGQVGRALRYRPKRLPFEFGCIHRPEAIDRVRQQQNFYPSSTETLQLRRCLQLFKVAASQIIDDALLALHVRHVLAKRPEAVA